MARRAWIGQGLPPIWRDGEEFFLLGVDEQLYLVRSACPHRGGPLKFGHVDDENRVVCPMHYNAFPVNVLLAQPSTIRLADRPVSDPEDLRATSGTPSRNGRFSLLHLVHEDGELKIANLVTLSRAVLILPIIALLLAGQQAAALAFYVVAALTDAVDGWIARRSGRASSFGAQLDAAVDNLFSLGILIFLLLALPGLWARQGVALAVLFGAPLLYLAVSWMMRRRLMMFHFWSAKAGAFLLFCLWPLIAVTGLEGLVIVVAALVGFSRLEQVLFMLRGGEDLNAPHGLAAVSASPSA